ncbi:MAG TPA: hypothetical protein VEB40_11745 [Flavipsychrobacter sp.]|nr:hypothetical protein [Flavipsychrobacter sp.]
MKNLRVNNYELKGEEIVAHVSDGRRSCEYCIKRADFEYWLTDGTGVVDMSITHSEGGVITEVPITETIEQYWRQGEEINNSPVLDHLRFFLVRDEVAVSALKAELVEEQLKDLFAEMEPGVRAEAYASLLEYGLLKKEYGEQSASVVFKKILTTKAA